MANLFRIILQVGDIDHATDFYGRVLGTEGKRVSPERHYFDCEGTILAVLDPRAEEDSFDARPNVDYVYIAVDDIDATHASAIAAGATVAEGNIHGGQAGVVTDRPWGERSFYAKDPFGNHLCFVARSTMFTG